MSTVIFAALKTGFPLLQSTPLFLPAQNRPFRVALFFSLAVCLGTALFFCIWGKTGSFLLINSHHTPLLDLFFQKATFMGDGLIYIPLLLYCIFFNRSFLIPAALSILICLVLTHFLKRVIFPAELRPVSLEAQGLVIHKIAGLHINRTNSFPSGHTATAFATALLLSSIVKNWWLAILALLLALLVGYSRVYLAQHFVSDVLGGMVIGICTTLLSLWLHPKLLQKLPPSWQARLQKPLVP